MGGQGTAGAVPCGGHRTHRKRVRLVLAAALAMVSTRPALAEPVTSRPPALAPTPPLGWSTWYGLRCAYDEKTLREVADAMARNGLLTAGYRYLNVDDCWAIARSPGGDLLADPKRFPSGMKALADYVHARGLKFGIYTSAGTTTCQRDLQADASRLSIGSRGHEAQDMRLFASWGVDLVKVDWCGRYETQDGRSSYETFRDAIAATGRPMLLSICEWGYSKPWSWGKGVGQMWRIAMDTLNCWACQTDWGGIGVVTTFDRLAEVTGSGGPEGWNDPDSVMAGNGVLTHDEARAQLSVYAAAASPLILAADPRRLSPGQLAMVTNRRMLDINQDSLGEPGRRVRREDGEEVWMRLLSGGRVAIAVVNRSAASRSIPIAAAEIDRPIGAHLTGIEVWSGKPVAGNGVLRWTVPGHGAALFVLQPAASEGVRPPV